MRLENLQLALGHEIAVGNRAGRNAVAVVRARSIQPQNSVGRHMAHLVEVRGMQKLLNLQAEFLALRQCRGANRPGSGPVATAGHYGSAEQALGERTEDLLRHRSGTRRLAHQQDLGRIAAKLRNVVMDPLERCVLIQKTVVAGVTALLFGQFRMRHEAQNAEAIVEIDKDRSVLGNVLATVEGHA